MRYSISNTAEYGDLTRGEKVVGDATRAAMKKTLADIQDGTFAREWIKETKMEATTSPSCARKNSSIRLKS